LFDFEKEKEKKIDFLVREGLMYEIFKKKKKKKKNELITGLLP